MHELMLTSVEIPEAGESRGSGEGFQDFSGSVEQKVAKKMEPYSFYTQDPKYLVFCDETGNVKEEYEGVTDCLKLPQGKIVSWEEYPYYTRFVIRGGKVYEKDSGPVRQERRTKCAKRIQALPDYPWRMLYPDLRRYAEEWKGYTYNEERDAYGFYNNPDGQWADYAIGGQWPFLLPVKNTCKEYAIGERSAFQGKVPEAPSGCVWASAARKKDIAWEALRNWNMCKEGQQYLRFSGNYQYPIYADGIISDDGWRMGPDRSLDYQNWKKENAAWRRTLDIYLESRTDEQVLVVLDCHL